MITDQLDAGLIQRFQNNTEYNILEGLALFIKGSRQGMLLKCLANISYIVQILILKLNVKKLIHKWILTITTW